MDSQAQIPDTAVPDPGTVVRAIAPASLSRRWTGILWTTLIVVLLGGAAATFGTRIPIYRPAPGTVVGSAADGYRFVIFIDPDDRDMIRQGLDVLIRLPGTSRAVSRPIELVEPNVVSPDEARRRLGLDGAAAQVVTRPAILAWAAVPPPPAGTTTADYLGSVTSVMVIAGHRRPIVTLLQSISDQRNVR